MYRERIKVCCCDDGFYEQHYGSSCVLKIIISNTTKFAVHKKRHYSISPFILVIIPHTNNITLQSMSLLFKVNATHDLNSKHFFSQHLDFHFYPFRKNTYTINDKVWNTSKNRIESCERANLILKCKKKKIKSNNFWFKLSFILDFTTKVMEENRRCIKHVYLPDFRNLKYTQLFTKQCVSIFSFLNFLFPTEFSGRVDFY